MSSLVDLLLELEEEEEEDDEDEEEEEELLEDVSAALLSLPLIIFWKVWLKYKIT